MQEESEVLGLNVILEGEIREHFLQIKKAKGLKNNSEAVRFIITELYNKIFKEA